MADAKQELVDSPAELAPDQFQALLQKQFRPKTGSGAR